VKTKLTLALEQTLYAYCSEKGYSAVEEVALPDDFGIVDMLALRTDEQQQQEWRCYELKISKADFHSTARLSFVGHYNYFVLTAPLTTHFVLALAREADQFKRANIGLAAYSTERLYAELRKRGHHYDPSGLTPNYYEQFIKDVRADAVEQLKAELVATEADYQQLLRRYHQVKAGNL
jgi:hypothetical protein